MLSLFSCSAPMDTCFIGAVVCYGKEYRDEIC